MPKKEKDVKVKNNKSKKEINNSKSKVQNKNNLDNKNSKEKAKKKEEITKSNKKNINEIDNLLEKSENVVKLKFNKSKLIRFILICILSLVVIFSVFKLALNRFDMFRNKKDSKELIKNVLKYEFDPNLSVDEKENLEDIKIDFEKLLSINKDTIGWMIFNNKIINNPLVHTTDNAYYLNRNFNRVSSAVGTIFMDYRNDGFDDRNVVLFGHANLDRTMFGSLSDVFKEGFFDTENADIIYIYDKDNNVLKYQIFSYYIIETEEYYITTSFSSDSSFQSFINTIKRRSYKDTGIEVTTDDKILTLSTCAGTRGTSKRRVIHAKRIS